jgi:hypothetical protein
VKKSVKIGIILPLSHNYWRFGTSFFCPGSLNMLCT